MSALGQDYVTLPGAAGAPTMHRALRLLTGLSGLLLLAATGWLLSPRLAWLSSSFATSHDDSHHAGAAQNDAAKHLTGWQAAGVGAPGPLQQMPTPTKTDLYATPKQQHDVLFKFGLIADIQYADSEDAFNFDGSKRRFYRSALNSVRAGVRAWNEEPGGIAFVGQLGDIIDGKNNHPLKQSHSAVRTVTRLLEQVRWGASHIGQARIHHLVGNHEGYNFPRQEMRARLSIPSPAYYHFSPHPAFRFIVLDPYEISLCAHDDREHPEGDLRERALDMLNANNPNNVSKPGSDWVKGLTGQDRRWMGYNGAVSLLQLDWLDRTLRDARKRQQKAVLMSHIPLFPDATKDVTLVWNYQDILATLHRHAGVVVATFAGHDHCGGYGADQAGAHHVVLQSPLERDDDKDVNSVAFATVSVFADRMELVGYGRVPNRTLHFSALSGSIT